MTYTPTVSPEDDRPSSSSYIITRSPPDNYTCNKLPEICSPFGLERFPAYQFTARLRNFEPDLKEVLVVSSTASTDIGLFTRSTKPLSSEGPVDTFTATTMSEDSRRAVLPMTDDMADTSPIGLALDLSCKDPVANPITGEETESSGHPLPEILILNNDGVLSSWWFVYSDSIRQQKPYHAITGATPAAPQQVPSTPMAPPAEKPKPASGQSGFGQPAFGQPAFGKPSFGTPALGSSQPSTQPSGGPSFGASTPLGRGGGHTSGSPSMLGQKTHAFGQATALGGGASTTGPQSAMGGFGSFAQQGPSTTGAGGGPGASPFSGSGFSSFAGGGGFAALGGQKPQQSTESPFSQTTGTSPFASAERPAFGGAQTFGSQPAATTSPSADSQAGGATGNFGLGSNGFVLGSSFQQDKTATTKEDKPAQPSGAFSLGSAFGNLLNDTNPTNTAAASPPSSAPAPTIAASTTSTFPGQDAPTSLPSLFGASRPQEPQKPAETTTPTSSFTQPSPAETQKGPPSQQQHSPPVLTTEPSLSESTVKVEAPSEPEPEPEPVEKIPEPSFPPEPPLPPEPTSKTVYAPGDTSASSSNSKASIDEAPLPPDFVKPKPKPKPPQEDPVPLPEESEGENAEFEDSGEDVPNEGHQVKSFTSRESSFGGPVYKAATGVPLPKASELEKKPAAPKPLFGEIAQATLPPPKLPENSRRLTPRSPSPVRDRRAENVGKTDGIRSTSAPSAPGRALSQRKATLESSMLANQVTPPAADEEEALEDKTAPVEPQPRPQPEAEQLELVEDNEDEQLHADLQRPLSPAPSLDPFLPHQDYSGESFKPGIPGQIERLYRDINSMIDTLGINSRSLSAFLLYQETKKESDYKRWLRTLEGDRATDLLNEKLLLSEIDKLPRGVERLHEALEKGQVHGIHEKLEKCRQLVGKDVATLRGQCASMRRTLDSHTDVQAIASAPLSAEQSSLQQDLRQSFTDIQSKLADLERDISQLRAGVADASQPDSSAKGSARPSVEAVTSTINTMTNMAEKKSGDIDVLEAQMKKLGIDHACSSSVGSPRPSRGTETSPFQTPQRKQLRFPMTPGSRDTADGVAHTAYHTPDSAGRLRSSLLGKSPLDGANGSPSPEVVPADDVSRYRARTQRRKELAGHVRTALQGRKGKIRALDG